MKAFPWPVSYTHLDVYKRQDLGAEDLIQWRLDDIEKARNERDAVLNAAE